MSWRSCVGAIVLALGTTSLATAHHSFAAEFDAAKPITLSGPIVRVEWMNPHCLLWMEVRGDTGAQEQWGLELPPPNALARRGVRRTTLTPGDTVVATVYPAKNGRHRGIARAIAFRDGVYLRFSSAVGLSNFAGSIAALSLMSSS